MTILRAKTFAFLLALAGLFAFGSPTFSQLLPRGLPEVLLPDATANQPAIAAHPQQGALALFERADLPGQGNLRARRFADDGAPLSGEIVVNDSNDAAGSAVAYDGQGHFVAVWAASQYAAVPQAMFTRRLALDGTPDGPVRLLSTGPSGRRRFTPQVSCDPDGRCAVLWGEGNHEEVVLRLLDATGAPAGAAIPVAAAVSDPVTTMITTATVAKAPDGTVAVLWIVNRYEGAVPMARFFDAQGQPLTDAFEIDPEGEPIYMVGIAGAWNADGRLLVTWDRGLNLFTRLLDASDDLSFPRRPLRSASWSASLAWCGGLDHFAALFNDGAVGSSGLRLQLLDAAGEPVGSELPVVSTATEQPGSPSLACDGHGRLWALWRQYAPDAGVAAELDLARFAAGEPICRGPFTDPPGAVPCGFVGDGGQFLVYAAFRNEAGVSSYAEPINVSHDAAFFAFYDAENPELAIKTVDGTSLNDHFWFFYGALSDREYMISVYDRATGLSKAYYNRLHHLASVGDTNAFPATAPALADALAPASPSERAGASATSPTGPSFVPRALSCPNDPKILCLPTDGFRVTVHWRDFQGNEGDGTAVRLTGQGGWFWFFGPTNLELAVKVLDGRGVNGYFWVFYASLTNVEFTLRVLDEQGNLLKEYVNTSRDFRSVADTRAF